MKASDLFVRCLEQENAEYIFDIPGVENLDLLDSLSRSTIKLIILYPSKQPAVCESFTELIDLYPSIAKACGLEVPAHVQCKDILPMLDDPTHSVRDAAFGVNSRDKGFLLRTQAWAYIQYGEDAGKDVELYDMHNDRGKSRTWQMTRSTRRPSKRFESVW